MTMDLIKIGDNGQLEFDFESLEAITSAEFVAAVKSEIPVGHVIYKCQVGENFSFVSLVFLSTFSNGKYGDYAYSCGFHKHLNFYNVQKMLLVEVELLNSFINS